MTELNSDVGEGKRKKTLKLRRETKPKRKTRQMGKEQGRVAVRKRGGDLREGVGLSTHH